MGKEGNLISDRVWRGILEARKFLNRENLRQHRPPRRRLIIPVGSGGIGISRRAILTADAGSGSTITANLFHIKTGVEQTSGDESGITVYFNLSRSVDLNTCAPLLEIDNIVTVSISNFDNAGTPEPRWTCVQTMAGFEECLCS